MPNATPPSDRNSAPPVTEAEVDAVLAEFDGDGRTAIRALLEDIATLAHDHVTNVSLGFVRGEVFGKKVRQRRQP